MIPADIELREKGSVYVGPVHVSAVSDDAGIRYTLSLAYDKEKTLPRIKWLDERRVSGTIVRVLDDALMGRTSESLLRDAASHKKGWLKALYVWVADNMLSIQPMTYRR